MIKTTYICSFLTNLKFTAFLFNPYVWSDKICPCHTFTKLVCNLLIPCKW